MTLEIDGKQYELEYDFNSICTAEEVTGCNLFATNANAGTLRALLWAFLLPKYPAMRLSQVGTMIRPDTRDSVMKVIGKMIGGEEGDGSRDRGDTGDTSAS